MNELYDVILHCTGFFFQLQKCSLLYADKVLWLLNYQRQIDGCLPFLWNSSCNYSRYFTQIITFQWHSKPMVWRQVASRPEVEIQMDHNSKHRLHSNRCHFWHVNIQLLCYVTESILFNTISPNDGKNMRYVTQMTTIQGPPRKEYLHNHDLFTK